MKAWRLHFPIQAMSRLLEVSRSGFYAWQGRKPSRRQREDERLKVAIKAVHQRSRESYGVRRLQPELAAEGFPAGRDRIARLRQDLGLRCRQKRKFRATTNSKHSLPVAENVLNQTFTPKAPDEIWLTDITYVATDEGWLYLAVIIDLYSRKVIGWAMSERMTATLVCDALQMALFRRKRPKHVIVHSDRGSQYCFHDY